MSMLYKKCVSVIGVRARVLMKRELRHTGIIDLSRVEGMKVNVSTFFFILTTNDWDS